MSITFTNEAEKRRQRAIQEQRAKKAPTWELLKTSSLVEALQFARKHGWEHQEVQVKAYRITTEEFEYHVEPWEKDCSCPNLLYYEDYFDEGPHTHEAD